MKKVILVVGTRPEAIKMAPIYREMKRSAHIEPFLLSTGQHREMLTQTLGAFGLTPDHDLGLMLPNQTLPELTARAIVALSNFFW
jgi:UDP-N-acetylglucosamine 2-epimerase (non-hydrolysing)